MDKEVDDHKEAQGVCIRCGKVGHTTEDCFRPLVCTRYKEGHVPRACPKSTPWGYIAPFCRLAAPKLGFHIIRDDDTGEFAKDISNFALIIIK